MRERNRNESALVSAGRSATQEHRRLGTSKATGRPPTRRRAVVAIILLLLSLTVLLTGCPNPAGGGGNGGSAGGGNDDNSAGGGNAGYTGPLVTSNADSGPGSLRQVVTDAPSGSEVRFLHDMTITLTGDRQGIPINKDLIISGVNAAVTITTAGGQRHFTYQPGSYTLSLRDLTLSDGAPQNPSLLPGGSIYVGPGSALILANVTFDSNLGTRGGAVFVEENASFPTTVTVSDATFRDNEARGDAGSANYGLRGVGGAIYQRYGTLTISRTNFEDNFVTIGQTSQDDGLSGGALYARDAALTVADSTFSGNRAGRVGGAIMGYTADLEVVRSSFTSNRAGEVGTVDSLAPIGGGAIFAFGSTESELRVGQTRFLRNRATGPDNASTDRYFVGGAIGTGFGVTLIVHASEFFGNTVSDTSTVAPNTGGAIHFGGGTPVGSPPATLELNSVAFVGNSATGGGYGGGASRAGGIAARDSGADVRVQFVSMFANDAGGVPADLEIANPDFALTDSAFGSEGFALPDLGTTSAIIERVVGPFVDFDGTDGNVNAAPNITLPPGDGADDVWGTADDYYGDLTPVTLPGGIENLYDDGRTVGLALDAMDLDNDGDLFDTLSFDAAGNPRDQSAHPDIGAYERQ